MSSGYALVLTTCGDAARAELIAKTLIDKRLAACVQILPINSFYEWEGAVQNALELLLLCKIKSADYFDVEAAIKAAHDYEIPEIIQIAIESGAGSYLSWIASVTR
ncbi:divalent-cation tolerance protein CutA [Methylocapsa acidiphila]|uniref:divalent-cation tolerance protein CutA n=1 Tax=Methylocapsa acidiphila TaxID=133552 RepID=UPI0003F8E6F7|nr:divalent-cation tolerance protein CutA [Methylocapsa acidiphila]